MTNDNQLIHLDIIKKSYTNGIEYYNQKKFNQSIIELTKVLKLMSKSSLPINIQNVTTEIINSIFNLGQIYLNYKSQDNFIKAAAIFQYCANFSDYYLSKLNYEHYILQAQNIESVFCQHIGINNLYPNKIEMYKTKLYNFRQNVKLCLLPNIIYNEQIHKLCQECCDFFINNENNGLIQQLIIDCIEQLGTKAIQNCEYAIIGLGSTAYQTMTPWSDLEFAILINNKNHKEYFRTFTRLLNIKVINFGETNLKSVGIEELNNYKSGLCEDNWFEDNITKIGFCFDGVIGHACKTPLGRFGYKTLHNNKLVSEPDYELIGTPFEMAQFQSDEWFRDNKFMVQALRSVRLIYGSQKIVDEYQLEINRISPEIVRMRTKEILCHDLNKYTNLLNDVKDVKYAIYRPIDRIIRAFADYYNIGCSSSWIVLEKLKDSGILSSEWYVIFENALTIAIQLRLRCYSRNTYKIVNQDSTQKQIIDYFLTIIETIQKNMDLWILIN
jgi:hypothetical protein